MKNPLHILLVEDNEGDVILTTEVLEESGIPYTLSLAKNGREALDFVFKKGKFTSSKSPDLIFLDINIPLKNGHEVLQELKNHDATKKYPVIVLTTSCSERDISMCFKNDAKQYLTKPLILEDFREALNKIFPQN